MSRRAKLAVVVAFLAVLTGITVWLWIGVLSSPLGRTNASALFGHLVTLAAAAVMFGAAANRLPVTVRPSKPYEFGLCIALGCAGIIALAAGVPR